MRNVLLALLLASSATLLAQSPGPYAITHTYTLGGDGGWDYVNPDPPSHRVYIARSDRTMVVDAETGKLIGEVAGVNGAHGTAIVHSVNRGYLTSSGGKDVAIFDPKTLKILSRTPAADDADADLYDVPSNRVFTMNGDANSSTVLDAKTGKLIANIALGGKPEYAVSAGDGMLYANLVDKDEIVEIDAKAAKVTRRWSTTGCRQPVAQAIDTATHRLFTGCRSGVLAVSDYTAGKVLTTLPIGKGVDSAAFDPATHDIFASNADGTLTVIHEETADKYSVLQTLTTPVGSRNCGLDPTTHKLYVVAADFGPAPAGSRRKPILPGTFRLLVIEHAQ
ncbi:MAG: PQQ-binding-like beta-propeller repeat protein [Acidobacteriota bacterium]